MRRHWCALDGPRDRLRGHCSRARVHKAVTSRRVVALSSGRDAVARAFCDPSSIAIRSPYRGAPFVRCRVARNMEARIGAPFARAGDPCGNGVVGRVAMRPISCKMKIPHQIGRNFVVGDDLPPKVDRTSRARLGVRRNRSLKIFFPHDVVSGGPRGPRHTPIAAIASDDSKSERARCAIHACSE